MKKEGSYSLKKQKRTRFFSLKNMLLFSKNCKVDKIKRFLLKKYITLSGGVKKLYYI